MKDFSYINKQCIAFNASRLSRAVVRLFSYELKENECKLTIGHFSLLAELTRKEEGTRPLVDISIALGMDRTTLLRNSNVLLKYGYIKKKKLARSHYLSITDLGRERLEEAIHVWDKINTIFLERSKKVMGYQYKDDKDGFTSQMIEDLQGIEEIAASIEPASRAMTQYRSRFPISPDE